MHFTSSSIIRLITGGLLTATLSVHAQTPGEAEANAFEFSVVAAADESAAGEVPATTGSLVGRIVEKDTGQPLGGVAIVLAGTELATVTDADGRYVIGAVPAGVHRVTCIKTGYIESNITDVEVKAGEAKSLSFALPPRPAEMSDEVFELQDFTVTAEEANSLVANIELRMNSDKMLDLFSSEDFSKFAAGDVADALKRVSGVNIVEGQFAIIRGLEDRYSSTTYNGAPIPSPDPNSQSVQLDLFPSDIVSNLVVAKTFSGELPGNSSGGSIDIVTHDYPEELEIKVSAGTGFNDNAADRFLELQPGSATGREQSGLRDVVESDFGISIGGRTEFKGREVRFKALAGNEVDFDTRTGVTESREPRRSQIRNFPRPPQVVRSGDLSLGQLSLSGGRFDLTQSNRVEQTTGYLGLGIDLDKEGHHKIDGSLFYTSKDEESVRLKENGIIPGFDYTTLDPGSVNGSDFDGFATNSAWIARGVRETPGDAPSRGHLWYAPTYESTSISQERDLLVGQLNGEHTLAAVEGLKATWAVNKASTSQTEEAYGARYFYEPDDTTQVPSAPASVEDLGPGQFASTNDVFYNLNEIEEDQKFLRTDLEYERDITGWLRAKATFGAYWERSDRGVSSDYLTGPTVGGLNQFAVLAPTQEELGQAIFDSLDRVGGNFSGLRNSVNDSTRSVDALHFGGKATLWEKLDLLGSFRLESLSIQSNNNPFFTLPDGRVNMYPNRFVLANIIGLPPGSIGDPFVEGSPFNAADQAFYQGLVNGSIEEDLFLPALGVTYRPRPGLSLRAAWSKTSARPSFREMGYYVSVEPGSSELVVGNPQLKLSDVESFDLRAEYTWGKGDLVAISGFKKRIANPIESIVVRDPTNFEASGGLFRTFINNPTEADLQGIELEARKTLDFVGIDFARHFSVGGNFTYIDAEVERTAAELANLSGFFGVAPGDTEVFSALSSTRRLYGQPEWIANMDVSFDHPEWGTKVTLAYYAISDILDSAGTATIGPTGAVNAITLDRYIGSFGQLDLVLSQTWGNWTFKLSVKNLTDSTRKVIYDPNQTVSEIAETSYKVGRDYSLSATCRF